MGYVHAVDGFSEVVECAHLLYAEQLACSFGTVVDNKADNVLIDVLIYHKLVFKAV